MGPRLALLGFARSLRPRNVLAVQPQDICALDGFVGQDSRDSPLQRRDGARIAHTMQRTRSVERLAIPPVHDDDVGLQRRQTPQQPCPQSLSAERLVCLRVWPRRTPNNGARVCSRVPCRRQQVVAASSPLPDHVAQHPTEPALGRDPIGLEVSGRCCKPAQTQLLHAVIGLEAGWQAPARHDRHGKVPESGRRWRWTSATARRRDIVVANHSAHGGIFHGESPAGRPRRCGRTPAAPFTPENAGS